VAVIQVLPLRLVARMGRACGSVACRLAGGYRRLAVENLALCFSGKERTAKSGRSPRKHFRPAR